MPVLILVAAAASLALLLVQGTRMARERHGWLVPERISAVVLPGSDTTLSVDPEARFALLDLGSTPPPRVGLHQVLPERTLVRWIEARDADQRWLVVPLRGLAEGTYWLTRETSGRRATAREMDQPESDLQTLAKFHLERR